MRRRGISALAIVLALTALGVGSWVNTVTPSVRDRVKDPFLREGTIAERVELRDAWLTVRTVDGARAVVTTTGTTATSANGTWLVLDLEFEDSMRPASIAGVTVESPDGRTYTQATSQAPSGCGPAQPHRPWTCQILVEMPADSLEGAVARIPLNALVRGDTVASIDLGITAARARELASSPGPITMRRGAPADGGAA